ncbi:5-oxoprolinase subunit PxpB [Chitinivorax tropicus]|uniref:5-oxoprolinase subunit PxpB n=1 Tax=Chitinivorax tropicus TaxID=714531 RepID=UPI001610DE67|nr:5-oxoprolinase subunit PxpB [Chitinivorax tropicus]
MVDTRFYLLGERAAVLESPAPANLVCQRRIWWLAAQLRRQSIFIDVVPGMNNLTVTFDPQTQSGDDILADLQGQWLTAEAAAPAPHIIELPVCYGGEDGPDLPEVARHTGLSQKAVIEQHSQAAYTVFFLGFRPGFAYMGGLPPALATPRRNEPRLMVRAGSIGIGGAQTGIYPANCPGGWQLIGRTHTPLFDLERDPPSLLLPGDQVRFIQVCHV